MIIYREDGSIVKYATYMWRICKICGGAYLGICGTCGDAYFEICGPVPVCTNCCA